MEIFNLVLYQPLFNALIFLHKTIPGHDLGIAIILLTLIIRLILYLPSLSSIKAQRRMQEIQPEINRIRGQYKNNKEELGRQMMNFYKKNKVNPFSSCLPLLIQLPILWALFRVFFDGLAVDPETGLLVQEQLNNLYAPLRDIYATTPVSLMFLGFVNLSATGNYILAFLAGIFQFLQSKMLMSKKPPKNIPGAKDEGMMAATTKSMTYFFPFLIFFISLRFPAGVAIYWIVVTLFSIAQQYIYFKKHPIKKEAT